MFTDAPGVVEAGSPTTAGNRDEIPKLVNEAVTAAQGSEKNP